MTRKPIGLALTRDERRSLKTLFHSGQDHNRVQTRARILDLLDRQMSPAEQIWLFVTPIAYPSSLLPDPWRTLYGLNPMAGVVEGFRWALLGSTAAPGPMVAVSVLIALLLLVSGTFYFRRMEKTFADVV